MSAIRIRGLSPLKGEIKIQGSKNAVLPMMAAAVLHNGITTLMDVPVIQDVLCMMGILEHLGCRCKLDGHVLTIDATCLTSVLIPEEQVKKMRSSIMLLGPLLGRCGEALTYYPGGCSIGKRPIDLHLHALRCLGAEVSEDGDAIRACTAGLTGGSIYLKFPSVGATENALMAAVLAKGETRIHNAAMEPEIGELCLFLTAMGAEISGIGSSELTVCGGRELHDVCCRVCGDRIVAGTYMAAIMAAGGEACLLNAPVSHMKAVIETAERMGAEACGVPGGLSVRSVRRLCSTTILTGPYPDFPTDLQSIMLAVMAVSEGTGKIWEKIFEGRFETAKELQKLGARIAVDGTWATVKGIYPLQGKTVAATDLRGGAALVVAGLAAEGMTVISDCHHIVRGYEDICRDLSCLGAEIEFLDEIVV